MKRSSDEPFDAIRRDTDELIARGIELIAEDMTTLFAERACLRADVAALASACREVRDGLYSLGGAASLVDVSLSRRCYRLATTLAAALAVHAATAPGPDEGGAADE